MSTLIEKPVSTTYTIQTAFDLVWNHFCVNEGKMSYNSTKRLGCLRYKVAENEIRKCAFGLLIPDDAYKTNFEGVTIDFFELQPPQAKKSWQCALSSMIARLGLLHPNGVRLIGMLQEAHDLAAWNSNGNDAVFSRLIRENLIHVATRLKLTIPCNKA